MTKQVFTILLLLASLLSAQELDIYGYFEPQYTVLNFKDNYYNVSSNKLRLDIAKDLSDRVSFGANFDYITYHGKTEWNMLDYLPTNITAQVPSMIKPYFVFNFGDMVSNIGPMYVDRADKIFLDNAYVRLAFDKFDLTVGKQQLPMGTGYTWNPTDVFNHKDILDPTYEQPGQNAIKLEMPLGDRFSLVSILAAGEEWKDTAKMLKLKSRLGHFDVSVMGLSRYWTFTDYYSFQAVDYKRDLIGGDLVGELLSLGVWAEGAYNMMESKSDINIQSIKDHWEWLAGIDYTFESGLYVMGEYYHNSMAKSDWQNYDLNDWMWMFSSEMKTLSQDQFSGLVQYPATDLITAGLSTIYSISDGSAALVPMIVYSVFQDVELTVFGNYYTGKNGRCYAQNMGNGGLARLRVYF